MEMQTFLASYGREDHSREKTGFLGYAEKMMAWLLLR